MHEALPQPAAKLTAWAAVPSMEHAVQLLGMAHQQLGAGLTGFEVMGQFALSLVGKHMPQLRVPFLARTMRPGACCSKIPTANPNTPAHASNRCSKKRLRTADCVTDAVVAENLTQAHQLWHIRENIPLAQAEEGLNIKLRHLGADLAHPRLRGTHRCGAAARDSRRAPGQLRPPGRWQPALQRAGTCGGRPQGLPARQRRARHQLVYDAVAEFGGSFSAEHGVGELKADKLEKYQSPVALSMMRAIKQALDPQGIMNPGRVLKA